MEFTPALQGTVSRTPLDPAAAQSWGRFSSRCGGPAPAAGVSRPGTHGGGERGSTAVAHSWAREGPLPPVLSRCFLRRLFPGRRWQGHRRPVGRVTLSGGKASGWALGPLPDPRPRAASSRCRAPPLQLRGESRCRGPPSRCWNLGARAWEDGGWLPFWASGGGGRGPVLTAELLWRPERGAGT